MPALNFSPSFADKISRGDKKQTIRRIGKVRIEPGSRLYLYTGLRTKNARRISVVRCTSVERIVITTDDLIEIGRHELDLADSQAFARADGFQRLDEFMDFFSHTYGLPFEGRLIKWEMTE